MPYAPPRIATLFAPLLPDAPDGWSKTGRDAAHYPILLFGPYTYTALSRSNGDYGMKIVAWDMHRNLVKELDKPGARWIRQITFDPATKTVTFDGDDSKSVQATLDELVVRPSVVRLSSASGPVLPYTLTYAAADPSQFPVIKSGPFSFWPASYKDGTNSFCVVVVDGDNVIQRLIACPGGQVIQDIQVDDANHKITLEGQNNSKTTFDYDTALACYYCLYTITKDDFLFLAKYFNVTLSDANAKALANAMPPIDCSLCCRMDGTYTEAQGSDRMQLSSTATVVVGALLGGAVGGLSGFLLSGPGGIAPGVIVGFAIGKGIGDTIPSSSDTGAYTLSSLEKDHSLIGYREFPCGPFDNTGLRENIFDSPFPRYQDLPYSAAVTRLGTKSFPQAYSPATKAIGAFPRDSRYKPLVLRNGILVVKYIFVIVKTDEKVEDQPGYQMRINPEDFYPDTWPANQRVNHSQLSEGYRFWALVGHPHMQVYAAGNLYVDITSQVLLGIDTRTGHYYRSFIGHDREVNDATLGFLRNLGYPTDNVLHDADIGGYLQRYMIG